MPITTARAAATRRAPSRRTRSLALVVVGLLAAAGCSATPQEPVRETRTVLPTVAPTRTAPPEPVVPVVWPLTGVATKTVSKRPAIAVKIENTPSARPQTGLEDADVVWETVVEFEISRFIAVYHSSFPKEVGPIRSVRPMDIPVTEPLKGLLAFSGGQSGILRDVERSQIQAISNDEGAPGMYRVSHRTAPHNVYGSLHTFAKQADKHHSAAPAAQFAFARSAELASARTEGTNARRLSFRLSSVARPSWTWHSSSRTWLRSDGGAKAVSADGDRLRATNVVSITASHPRSRYRAQGGASVPTYDLVGSGKALVATGGKVVQGTWHKASSTAPMELRLPGGDPLLLAPGTTWVELVPRGTGSVSTG